MGVSHCYSEFSRSHAVVLRQRQVFERGDYAARPSLIEDLAKAAAAYPEEEQFVLLAGLMRLWRIVEPDGLEAIDLLGMLDAIDKSERDLQRAYALCPTDHRIPGWLGPLQVKAGRATGDAKKLEAGTALMQRGAETYPDFVMFTQVLAFGVLPVSDPDFQRARDGIDFYRGRCKGERLDTACVKSPTSPHNFEGAALFFGDTLAKAQDRQGALAWYTGAMKAPKWSSWPFRDRLEQRIQRLDQRIAAAATPDTSDDEPFFDSERQCSLCHRE
jgi:hypothetical protein